MTSENLSDSEDYILEMKDNNSIDKYKLNRTKTIRSNLTQLT